MAATLGVTAMHWTVRVWRGLGRVIAPLVRRLIDRRLVRGKEDPARVGERFGHAGRARPDGALIWFHAASVGEFNMLPPLFDRLLADRPALSILVTTGTLASAKRAAAVLSPHCIHQFVPVDLPDAVDRFFAHWRPDAAIFVESEFWPGLIGVAARRGVPLALINGRVTAKAEAGWRWGGPVIAAMLRSFALVLARGEEDAARLRRLGAREARVLGDLKNAAPPLAVATDELARLKAAIGDRPVWVAASTHPGEDEIAIAAHRALLADFPDLLTVIVPRHVERGASIAALAGGAARRAAGDDVPAAAGIYVADTLGELGLWYSLARVAVVGGSLVPHGGQNMLEPARLGCPILHGPHVGNFADLAAGLDAAGAARTVADEVTLAASLRGLLTSGSAERIAMAKAAQDYAGASALSLDQVLDALAPLLPRA